MPVNGHLIEMEGIECILHKNPATLFVIDEADTVSPDKQAACLTNRFDNVVFLGSLSKFYGLSGMRIGYLITPKVHAVHFRNTINVIEVGGLAILAGNIVMDDQEFQRRTQKNVRQSLVTLETACVDTPYCLAGSEHCFACYIFSTAAGDPVNELAEQNLKILPGTYFGLPEGTLGGRFNLAVPDNATRVAKAIQDIHGH